MSLVPPLSTLAAELQKAQYSGLSDTAAAALVNSQNVASAAPAILNPTDVVNAIVPADLLALTTNQLLALIFLLSGATVNGSPGTTVRGVIQSIFSGKATTLANLSALVSPFDNATIPLYQQLGFARPVEWSDVHMARAG